jgi:hypothetical protein
MYQSRRLKSLSWLFLGEPGGGQLPQFVIDEWQELLGGLWIARFDLR